MCIFKIPTLDTVHGNCSTCLTSVLAFSLTITESCACISAAFMHLLLLPQPFFHLQDINSEQDFAVSGSESNGVQSVLHSPPIPSDMVMATYRTAQGSVPNDIIPDKYIFHVLQ
jgi:hypothetical protein